MTARWKFSAPFSPACAGALLALAVASGAAGCATGASVGAPVAGGGRDRLLTVGMTRPVGTDAALFSAGVLNSHLSWELGGDVVTLLFDDAVSLGDALAAGQVDVAWLSPVGYVRAAERAEIRPLARLSRGGHTSYRSVIFTRAETPARALADLKGRSMIWVAKGSASGFLFPQAHLKKAGLDPERFFSNQLVGTDHKEVCEAVLQGRADAGASISDERAAGDDLQVDGCREAGLDPARFRVLERTGPIPNDVLASRAGLPPALEARVKSVLLAMADSEDGRARIRAIFRADGFAPVADEDFAPVREVRAFLEGR